MDASAVEDMEKSVDELQVEGSDLVAEPLEKSVATVASSGIKKSDQSEDASLTNELPTPSNASGMPADGVQELEAFA